MQVRNGWAVVVDGVTVKELSTLERAESYALKLELQGNDVELMEVEL